MKKTECTTPIVDFVTQYCAQSPHRLHLPGHKGVPFLGCEARDLTEVAGADDLSHPTGILLESEQNATALFGSRQTFYATGGSSQCVRAMLWLALLHHGQPGKRARILAARNVHKSFVHACALLDLDVSWITPLAEDALCSCTVTPDRLRAALAQEPPLAVYLTSPDYLGGQLDLAALAAVCRTAEVPLLVDNAHGAYLKFLPQSAHPLDLGASMCCDSAHKTLPVLTGGAYLQVAADAPAPYEQDARQALALFGSTSPSYLVLQSLDQCNRVLSENYRAELAQTVAQVDALKQHLTENGVPLRPSEPLKITVDAAAMGSDGETLADHLRRFNIECEFADLDFVVLMVSTSTGETDLEAVRQALEAFPIAPPRPATVLALPAVESVLSIRQALFAKQETVAASQAVGRICAAPTVSCPPAVPLVLSGERITPEMLPLFAQYQIPTLSVVQE